MSSAARLAPLIAAVWAVAATELPAQGRAKQVECSFLLFSGCRNYDIDVVRITPDGALHPQEDADTYQFVNPDRLGPASHLVLELYRGDRLQEERAVIWVDRATGAVGGDWPSVLRNDAVRSAVLRGVPGDRVELYDDRHRRPGRALTRMVIFAGRDACRTATNLNDRGSGCITTEGRGVAGKVSAITIWYRGTAEPAAGVLPPSEVTPQPAVPPDSVGAQQPAAADSAGRPVAPDSVGPALTPSDSVPAGTNGTAAREPGAASRGRAVAALPEGS
ncbi:MAG: hypothetical protein ABR599_03505 [Gemmatimonadota bacterium]